MSDIDPLWTSIIDFEGGTYIWQGRAATVDDFLKLVEGFILSNKEFFGENDANEIVFDGKAQPLVGIINVWCTDLVFRDNKILICNIILTETISPSC